MKTTPTQFHITDSEKRTAILLLQDLTVKEIADLSCLSFAAVQSHAVHIREKMQSGTMYAALARMIVVNVFSKAELSSCRPEHWKEKLS